MACTDFDGAVPVAPATPWLAHRGARAVAGPIETPVLPTTLHAEIQFRCRRVRRSLLDILFA
jgi:hypothetical protein